MGGTGCSDADSQIGSTRRAVEYTITPDIFLIYADNSLVIEESASVQGHVGVRAPGAGGAGNVLRDGVRGWVGPWANVGADTNKDFFADWVILGYGSDFYRAEINGAYLDQHDDGYVTYNAFPTMPAFPRARPVYPGTTPVSVTASSTVTVSSTTSIASFTVGQGGVLRLGAGDYEVQSVTLERSARLHALGAVTLRVAGRLTADDATRFSVASGLSAEDLRIEVLGANAAPGGPTATPRSVDIGDNAGVHAVILAPNGTLRLGASSTSTGAFVAEDVLVEFGATMAIEDGLAPLSGDTPLAFADSYTVSEDQVLSVAAEGVLANDLDPSYEPITASLVQATTSGTVALSSDGSFSYTPNTNFTGMDTFTYTASDGSLTSATTTVTITVDAINDVPNILSSAPDTAWVGQMWRYEVVAVDADQGDTLTYSLTDAPSGMTITSSTGVISWMPTTGQASTTFDFTVTVTDTSTTTDTEAVSVSVESTPPVDGFVLYASNSIWMQLGSTAVNGSVGVTGTGSGSTLEGDVRALIDYYAKVGKLPGVDLMAEDIKMRIYSEAYDVYTDDLVEDDGTRAGSIASFPTMPTFPSTSSVAAGMGTWTISTSTTVAEGLGHGDVTVTNYACLFLEAGVHDFASLTLDEGTCLGALGPVEVHVLGRLSVGAYAYVGVGDGVELGTSQFRLEVQGGNGGLGGLLDRPSAVETSTASSMGVTLVAPNGTVRMGKNSVNWGFFAGRDIVTAESSIYFLEDEAPENHAPIITSDPNLYADEDSLYEFEILFSDADAEDSWTFAYDSGPSFLSLDTSGSTPVLQGTPLQADVSATPYTVTVRVTDAAGDFDLRTWPLTVRNVQDAPVFTQVPPDQNIDQDVEFTAQLGATDEDNDALTFGLVSSTSGFDVTSSGAISWTPGSAAVGPNLITVSVTDGVDQETASFTLTVVAANSPPVVGIPDQSATQDSELLVDLESYATDDNTAPASLTYALSPSRPYGVTIASNVLRWRPRNSQVGTSSITVLVSDEGGLETSDTFWVTVTNINDAPIVSGDLPLALPAGEPWTYQVQAVDPDNDTLTYVDTTAPAGLTVSSTTGVISWTPSAALAGLGPQDVVIEVSDGNGGTDQLVGAIQVETTDPPVAAFRTARGRAVSWLQYGAQVTVSSSSHGTPEDVIDVTQGDYGWNISSSVDFPQTLRVDLAGDRHVVDAITLETSASYGAAFAWGFEVWTSATSTQAEAFERVLVGSLPSGRHRFEFPPSTARYVELRLLDDAGYTGSWITLEELVVEEQTRPGQGIVSLALGGASVSATTQSGYDVDNLLSEAGQWYAGAEPPQTIDVDLIGTAAVEVDTLRLNSGNTSDGTRRFTLQASESGLAPFADVLTATVPDGITPYWFEFTPTLARSIRLIVESNGGSTSNTRLDHLAVYSPSEGGLIAVFDDQSTDPNENIIDWAWNFGDGRTSDEQHPTHVYLAPGTYQVELTVTDDTGLSSTTTRVYVATAPEEIDFSYEPTVPNEGGSMVLTQTLPSGAPASLPRLWELNGQTLGQSSPSASATSIEDSGALVMDLSYADGRGLGASRRHRTRAANVAPTVDAGSDTMVYWGETFSFDATVSDPSTVDAQSLACIWSFGDGTARTVTDCDSSSSDVDTLYGRPGIYLATLLVRDKDGAESVSTATVTATQRPVRLWVRGTQNVQPSGSADVVVHVTDAFDANRTMAGRQITMAAGAQTAVATIDAQGNATATLSLGTTGQALVSATFGGDHQYLSASTSAVFDLSSGAPVLQGPTNTHSSRGEQFVFALPNEVTPSQSGDYYVDVQIASDVHTVATVRVPGLSLPEQRVNVSPSQPARVALPRSVQVSESGTIEPKAVVVDALHPVTVEAFARTTSIEVLRALNVASLGSEYVVSTADPISSRSSQAVVAALEDGTEVTITPAVAVVAGDDTAGSLPAGTPFVVTLDQYEAIAVYGATHADLTGTIISATASVAVTMGVDAVRVGSGDAQGRLLVQADPVGNWGQLFHLTTARGRSEDEVFRVVAATDGTTLRVDRYPHATTLDRGEHVDIAVPAGRAREVTSSNPVSVMHLLPGDTSQYGFYYPAMRPVVPAARYAYEHRFTVPDYSNTFEAALNIIVPASETRRVLLNGGRLPLGTIWQAVGPTREYFSTTVHWTSTEGLGTVVLGHESGRVALGAAFYGDVGSTTVIPGPSIAVAGEARDPSVQLACRVSVSVAGDLIDNDCDGTTDEEIDNGIDDDNDGRIDEDTRLGTASNDAPTITSTASSLAAVGTYYFYDAVAYDPDVGDTLTWTISGPSGLDIDASTGLLEWIPTSSDIGTHTATVTVTDAGLLSDSQLFTVTVTASAAATPFIVGQTMCTETSTSFVTVIGPKPYLCGTDSAFDLSTIGSGFYLEDFESGLLESLGLSWVDITSNNDGKVSGPQADPPYEHSSFTDSVDCDDGVIDGDSLMGDLGHSWHELYAGSGFAFDSSDLGGYPTTVGFVWTDGSHFGTGSSELDVRIYDAMGVLVETSTFDLQLFADASYAGGTAEDRFFGFVYGSGISRIEIEGLDATGGIEVDHIQYGDCAAAESIIAQNGVAVGSITYVYSDTVPPNTIVSTDPQDLTTVPEGTPVDIVYSLGANQTPVLQNPGTLTATVGDLLTYQLQATDGDAEDRLVYALDASIYETTGLRLSSETGLLTWRPGTHELGSYVVTVEVYDLHGAFDQETFTIHVTGTSNPPVIASLSDRSTPEQAWFVQDVSATDADPGDRIRWSLGGSPPTGMGIDQDTGRITWWPQATQVGAHPITVVATDRSTNTDTATMTVTVNDLPSAPRITSDPELSVLEDAPLGYSYPLTVVDDDGDDWEVFVEVGPVGMDVSSTTGPVVWAPTNADVGQPHMVVLRVTDVTGLSTFQTFSVQVQNVNDPPVIVSNAPTTARQGAEYVYEMRVEDPDANDTLAYTVTQGPTGLRVSGFGRVTWRPVSAGSQSITVVVTDAAGASDSESFSVTVEADTTPPEVDIVASPAILDPNDTTTLTVQASHVSGITNRTLRVDGTLVTLNTTTWSYDYTPTSPGPVTLEATATNGNGESATVQRLLPVRDTSDTAAPVASIGVPEDVSIVTAPTTVTGTASDDNIVSWRLSYARGDRGSFVEFGYGTSSVENGDLADFDPTLLENGLYRILLEVTDVNGAVATDEVTVEVEGNMKVGVFTLSFVDLTIPLGGIPITVTRTYDSRVKESRDFGYGWDLSVSAGRFEHNRPLAESWDVPPQQPPTWNNGLFTPCVSLPVSGTFEAQSHITEVRLSDAEEYRFRPQLSNPGRVGGGCLFDVTFEQVDGVPGASLSVLGNATVFYQFHSGVLVDDITLAPFDPRNVRLETYDGRTYDLNRVNGVFRVEDLVQNELYVSNAGIAAYDAAGTQMESIVFVRDTEGRIDEIQAPNNVVLDYVYDASGDLITFVDNAGYSTRFTYDARHNLQDIFDPLGNRAVRSEYDTAGRLTATVDASGNRVEMTHDIGNRLETVADRLGNVTTYAYDVRGNVVTETYPDSSSIARTYDARDNMLTETSEVGVTTTWTYDSRDRRTYEWMIVSGSTVARSWAYDARGNLTAETDPLGNVTSSVYDARSLILSRTEPSDGGSGFTSTFEYDALGYQTRTCDPTSACRTMAYDNWGRMTRDVDERSVPTLYAYDAEGRMTSMTSTRAAAGGGVESLVTTYEYDLRGLQTRAVAPDQSATQVLYDARGLMTARIDQLGRTTAYVYDAQGRRTLLRHPDQTTEQTGYDVEGRMTSRMDRMGRIRTTGYDARGRMTSSTFDGVSISYAYDVAGRVTTTTDRRGFDTTQSYDEAGRVTEMRTPEDATATYPTRVSEYDDAGRLTASWDAKNRQTTYAYDPRGQLTQMTYADSTTETSSYDGVGRLTSKTDRGGTEVQHGYDAAGNLTSVTNVQAGETWVYAYDDQGNLTTITDPNDHTRTFAFDERGREVSRRFHIGPPQTRGYDSRGNLTRRSMYDPTGGNTTFLYDAQDRLTRRNQADGNYVAFTYWPSGQRRTATDVRGGVTHYVYDAQDRLTYYEQPDGSNLTYAYDSAGNLTARTAAVGTSQWTDGYSYDAESRITGVTAENPFTHVTEAYALGYDETGQLTSLVYPNGLTQTYGYDSLDQLTQIQITDATDAVVERWQYSRQADGNIDVITNLDGSTQTYGYDAADRLTSEVVRDAVSALVHTRTYEYDPAGNRTRVAYAPVSGVGAFDHAATFDARDRLLTQGSDSFIWDSDGRLISVAGPSPSLLSWDSENMLTQVQYPGAGPNVSNEYDAHGALRLTQSLALTGSSTTTQFLVDRSRSLVHIAAAFSPSSMLQSAHTRIEDLTVSSHGRDQNRYDSRDHLGSLRLVSDTFGAPRGRLAYTPFGVPHLTNEGAEGEFAAARPIGGLMYHRARWLDSSSGVFLSLDPWDGSPVDPRTLQRFQYAAGNPVVMVDPTGRFFSLASILTAVGMLGELITATRRVSIMGPFRQNHTISVIPSNRRRARGAPNPVPEIKSTLRSVFGIYGFVVSPGPNPNASVRVVAYDPADDGNCSISPNAWLLGRSATSIGLAHVYGQNVVACLRQMNQPLALADDVMARVAAHEVLHILSRDTSDPESPFALNVSSETWLPHMNSNGIAPSSANFWSLGLYDVPASLAAGF